MFSKLQGIISRIDADYADIRYEEKQETSISRNQNGWKKMGSGLTDGYVLRILKDGGFGTTCFTRFEDADKAIKQTLENASLLGANRDKKIELAKTPIIQDTFIPKLKGNPSTIPLSEKMDLIDSYLELAHSREEIASANFKLEEIHRNKFYLNTLGTEINEELFTLHLNCNLLAKKGDISQMVRLAAGGSDGFHSITDLEERLEEKVESVVELLYAEPVKGGRYNVILDPRLTGLFIHEAIGHFSEADILANHPEMRKRMTIGNKFGSDILSVTDDATIEGQSGYYKYDDEGVPVRRVELMKNGIITNHLHSRTTAAEFGEEPTGHAVAEDYRYSPIVRMGNIFVEPGTMTFDELLEQLGDGLYLSGPKGGQTAGANFTFGAEYGILIENGKFREMIRDINITGNLYETLKNITAVSDDLAFTEVGICGKNQLNLRSSNGGPHILVKNVVIGGV